MQSYCLKHQDRPASSRCRSCSKPLCAECSQPFTEGVYCGQACYDKALEATARLAVIKKDEEALALRRQKILAVKLVVYLVIFLALFLGWDYLPPSLTKAISGAWSSFLKYFKA